MLLFFHDFGELRGHVDVRLARNHGGKVMAGAIYVHFEEPAQTSALITNGWLDDPSESPQTIVRLRIGGNCAVALNRLRNVVGLDGWRVQHVFGEDIHFVVSEDTCRKGAYRFKGFQIMVRGSGPNGIYVSFTGPLEHFEELVLMLEHPAFSTSWLEDVTKQPVTVHEAAQRPTLAQRLATRRFWGRRRAA